MWLNGSFVTSKEEPGDFDCLWDPSGVDRAVLARLGPEFLVFDSEREAQKQRLGGEFLPNVTETASGKSFADFFQTARDGTRKGIVVIDLATEEIA